MSGPTTRGFDPPLEPTEMDNDVPPVAGLEVHGTGHSTKQETNIDKSTGKRINFNDWGPYVVICALVAGIALGMSIGARDTANSARLQIDNAVSESKRIAEREARLVQVQLDDLKSQLRTQGFKIENHEIP